MKPDLVILYDSEGGGLAQLASTLDPMKEVSGEEELFEKMNEGDQEDVSTKEELPETPHTEEVVIGRKGVPVKMPKSKKKRFCPYCGEEISTKKEPRFCPYCGEGLE
jgi:rubrerythrin